MSSTDLWNGLQLTITVSELVSRRSPSVTVLFKMNEAVLGFGGVALMLWYYEDDA